MAENRRGKENRYYYSRGQMVLLGAAFTSAAVVIFFLGMFVGKGVEERKILKKEEPLVKIPVKPEGAPGGGATQKKDEITFNGPEAKSSTPSVTEEKAKEKPAEKIAAVEALAPKEVEKKTEKIAAEAAPKKTESAAGAEAGDPGKVWRAQVNAFPDERSAILLVDRLKNRGYNAYVSDVQNRGKTWYRVSVGRYDSREQAEKIADALRTKENHPNAFAASK
jgi:cell division septation protein DedD